jgi:hypothetical protein
LAQVEIMVAVMVMPMQHVLGYKKNAPVNAFVRRKE